MIKSISETEFTALDIETTGLSSKSCAIVEIAALKVAPDGTETAFQTLVDPCRSIPAPVIAIHHITDAMVQGAPFAEDAVRGLVEFVGSSPLVLHNAPFDMSFINPVVRKIGMTWDSAAIFDTLRLSRLAFPGMNSYRLENLSRFFSFDAGGHHRALADCRYCAQLFKRILRRLSSVRSASGIDAESFFEKYASPKDLLMR